MKQELRRAIRQEKEKHRGEFKDWSFDICERIANTSRWEQAETILLYHALPDEPTTDLLLDIGIIKEKQLLLPVVVGDDLVLRKYEGATSMREGAFHIMEPIGEVFPESRYDEITLALIPGMAFDAEGHRLGRGKGYYDRLLPRLSRAYKMGVCFPFQMVDAVPSEPHDQKVDEVCCQ